MTDTMYVIKRNGIKQEVSFDKITYRIKQQTYGLNVNATKIAQNVISGLTNNMKTSEIDEYTASICHDNCIVDHPDYSKLASRILISNLHKETEKDLIKVFQFMLEHNRINEDVYSIIVKHYNKLLEVINHKRDYNMYDYFAIKTLMGSYLTKIDGKVVERPQHMLLRVSIGINGDDFDGIIKTYEQMSNGYYTHATPTLYNSGTERQQNSSCFLIEVNDNTESITLAVNKTAHMSRYAGGIGIHIGSIRSRGAPIRKTQGTSSGPIPFIKLFNETAVSFNQSGRRPGSFAIYLNVWHLNIREFIKLRLNDGNERERSRDIFPAVNVNDVFMERVDNNEDWTLFCPSEVDLYDKYGNDFREAYLKYEKDDSLRKTVVKARDIWNDIFKSLLETGMPYMLNLDEANSRNNQSNLGVLKGSNLCIEILIYTEGSDDYNEPGEVGTCNLASVSIPKFVNGRLSAFDGEIKEAFNWPEFEETIRIMTRNLNKVIDVNFYPIPDAKNSNIRHRPIAIGIQGLSTAFLKMRIAYTSEEAQELNRLILETMYYIFLDESCKLAEKDGAYSSFEGSPLSKGKFQWELWNERTEEWNNKYKENGTKYERQMAKVSDRYDWETLRNRIAKYGVRNSLGIALMPTATTSAIFGNTECYECITSNCYVKKTQHGEFRIANKYLIEDLIEMGQWNDETKNQLAIDEGSVQNLDIPDEMKEIYKTVFEQKQSKVVQMSVDRAPFICHTESNNIFLNIQKDKMYDLLHSILMMRWRKGCKTLNYYLHQRIPNAIKFNIDAEKLEKNKEVKTSQIYEIAECEACS